MSRRIKITPDDSKKIYEEFLANMQRVRVSSGSITFTKKFEAVQRRAKLYFSEKAWLKMSAIVDEFDKEVAWHALAYRDDDESEDNYYVTDILVYPQTVTASTVTTDQDGYENWLNEKDDETFNHLRFQGHSHVNMATSPSGVDTAFYDAILDGLADDDFYIFMIVNKRGQRTIYIYDYKKNIAFETADIDVEVVDGDIGLAKFIKEAKSLVVDKPKVVTPLYTATNYGGSSYGSAYGGSSYYSSYGSTSYGGYGSAASKAVTQSPSSAGSGKENQKKKETPAPASLVKGSEDEAAKNKKTGKRKGKRKVKNNVSLHDYTDY